MSSENILMDFQRRMHAARTSSDVILTSVNASNEIVDAGQCVFFENSWGRPRIKRASNLPNVAMDSPLVQELQRVIEGAIKRSEVDSVINFQLSEKQDAPAQFPFGTILIWDTKAEKPYAGLVLLSDRPWIPERLRRAEYISEITQHAYEAIKGKRRFSLGGAFRRMIVWGGVAATAAALWLLHVPISIVVPSRVVATDPTIVSAEIDGIVDEILVSANQQVEEGTVLARLDDTEYQAALAQSEQNLAVAIARRENLSRQALTRPNGRRELAIAEAEQKLAEIELKWAQQRLDRVELRANRQGVVSLINATDLQGSPVQQGQKLFEIIDPEQSELTADVPVEDAILMYQAQRIEIFLNDDPLASIDGEISDIPHQPMTNSRGGFSYPLTVSLPKNTGVRIGAEGQVHIEGPKDRLINVILRRPMMFIRKTVPTWLWS